MYFLVKRYLKAAQTDRQQQQQQHILFSQASWGRLEMKPERKGCTDRALVNWPILISLYS